MPTTSDRAEIVRRRIAFERDPTAFVSSWAASEGAERERIRSAQRLLPSVQVEDRLLELIAHICHRFQVDGLRADIVIYKAAATLAAYAGREVATVGDVQQAAELALPHRRRRQPFDQVGLDQQTLDDVIREFSASDDPPDPPPPPPAQEDDRPPTGDGHGAAQSPERPPAVFEAGAAPSIRLAPPATGIHSRLARGSSQTCARLVEGRRGRHIRSTAQPVGNIDVLATLMAAALQRRRPDRSALRYKVCGMPSGALSIFVVDASGSMAARRRMALAKGIVLQLLTRAYQTREEVAMIAVRGTEAALVLPPTSSINLAANRLRDLPTGGRTPLALGLRRAASLLHQRSATRTSPGLQRVVVVSDGRANVPLGVGGDGHADAVCEAQRLRSQHVQSVVIDTEDGPVRLQRAKQLAAALDAEYISTGSTVS